MVAAMQVAGIPVAYQRAAEAADVPPAILYAIALTESGRRSTIGQRPWPWTLNVAGQGRYFESRVSAWQHMQRALARHQNVDIGLMQVSWRYHAKHLRSPWNALNAHWNLKVGAEILRRCFDARGHWMSAIGCYHAPNDAERAARYRQRVQQNLERVTGHR